MQCKIHNPATYYRYNILDRRDWKFIPPPPLPPIKDRKTARFGFCAASSSSIFFFLGGGGGTRDGWLALPFYSVEDCSQDYLWDGLWEEKFVSANEHWLKNRMIKIGYFDFRFYWRVSILNTVLINHDHLWVIGEGKSMLGINAHI